MHLETYGSDVGPVVCYSSFDIAACTVSFVLTGLLWQSVLKEVMFGPQSMRVCEIGWA